VQTHAINDVIDVIDVMMLWDVMGCYGMLWDVMEGCYGTPEKCFKFRIDF
jgi:hypothetical protein